MFTRHESSISARGEAPADNRPALDEFWRPGDADVRPASDPSGPAAGFAGRRRPETAWSLPESTLHRMATQCVSFILGGALFVLVGLVLTGYLKSFGQVVMGFGGVCWLIGCIVFVVLARGRRGWVGVLIRMHASGLVAIVASLLIARQFGAPVAALAGWVEQLPLMGRWTDTGESLGGELTKEYYLWGIEALAMAAFGWEVSRVTCFLTRPQ